AFLLSGAMVPVGLYIRFAVQETPEFAALKARNDELRMPFADMMKRYPGTVVKGMGARYVEGGIFNVFAVFSISYLTSTIGISRTDALLGVTASAVVMCFMIPYFGGLSDRMGRARIFRWGALITAFSTFPGFWLMSQGGSGVIAIWLGVVVPLGFLFPSV